MGTRTLPHSRTAAGSLAAQRFDRPRAQTLLVARLRTIKSVAVTVPNGTVLGSQVINIRRWPGLAGSSCPRRSPPATTRRGAAISVQPPAGADPLPLQSCRLL